MFEDFKKLFKSKPPILVTINFATGVIIKAEFETMKQVILCFYRDGAARYDYWMNDDIDDVPLDGYEITNLKLNKGKVVELELTEQFIGGYNV